NPYFKFPYNNNDYDDRDKFLDLVISKLDSNLNQVKPLGASDKTINLLEGLIEKMNKIKQSINGQPSLGERMIDQEIDYLEEVLINIPDSEEKSKFMQSTKNWKEELETLIKKNY
ncbi:MAG: hypothetical protein WCT77_09040, partial [Bacteroidota bacterium]